MEVALGVAMMLVAKWLAYSFYLGWLARRWNAPANGWKWALVRIALGAAVGGILWLVVRGPGTADGFGIYVVGLGIGRALAWALTLGLAFGERVRAPALAGALVAGVALSYAVDIPVFFGWISAIGGIC
jgi:hypothetical protein